MNDLDSPSGAIAETIARSHRILTTDTWNGFRRTRFEFGGREASVVEPSAAAPAGRPWTWTMQWWDAFVPRTGVPDLLARGFHHVWIDLFGTRFDDGGIAEAAAFQRFLVDELGFAPQARLIGMSWGGFASVRYASAHPRNVRCVYLDAPLLDFTTLPNWPKWQCCKTYNVSEDYVATNDPRMPVNMADGVAKSGAPVYLLYGGVDRVVPPAQNCKMFVPRLKAAGVKVTEVARGAYAHHPHGLEVDDVALAEFFKKSFGARAPGKAE